MTICIIPLVSVERRRFNDLIIVSPFYRVPVCKMKHFIAPFCNLEPKDTMFLGQPQKIPLKSYWATRFRPIYFCNGVTNKSPRQERWPLSSSSHSINAHNATCNTPLNWQTGRWGWPSGRTLPLVALKLSPRDPVWLTVTIMYQQERSFQKKYIL